MIAHDDSICRHISKREHSLRAPCNPCRAAGGRSVGRTSHFSDEYSDTVVNYFTRTGRPPIPHERCPGPGRVCVSNLNNKECHSVRKNVKIETLCECVMFVVYHILNFIFDARRIFQTLRVRSNILSDTSEIQLGELGM